jgi:hypothetical protein
MINLTHEEQERLAYIQGDLAKAELLQALLDAEDEIRKGKSDLFDAHVEHEGSTCD